MEILMFTHKHWFPYLKYKYIFRLRKGLKIIQQNCKTPKLLFDQDRDCTNIVLTITYSFALLSIKLNIK